MLLSPGTTIGPYEVTSAIGAGGMGEVYRARDTRLKRDVALKVLPAAFASDPDRLARFQREAELLATLNHPHIAAIYGIEQSDNGTALVLELVEGETLADRIARGPIPVDEALPIARQIAAALEAAHEQGVIHRDLKPANIKVTPDGDVKVLDFGLAKLNVPNASTTSDAASMSPTITSPAVMTGVGTILGTAAYMSPEQAKGRDADRRSDVWAFGCVLYEMLTGRRAFAGEGVADTVAAVLRGEPDWSKLPADIPRPVAATVRRCLEKDRRKRIGDVAAALAIIDDSSLSAADGPERIGALRAAVSPRVWSTGAALVLVVVTSAVTAWTMRPATSRVSRLAIAPAPAHALAITGQGRNVAISPDGSRIAYVGVDSTLLVRSLDQLEPTILVRGGTPIAPFFSPDGQWIGYFASNGPLRKVSVGGGPTAVVATSDSARPAGASWGDDGTIVFATTNRSTGLQIAAPGETTPRILTTPDRQRGEADHLWPEFLPGGRAVLFTILSTTTAAENTQIAVFDLDAGRYQVVMPGGSHAHYVPTGHLVYGAAGGLRAVPFDADRLAVTRAAASIVSSVLTTPDGAADFDVADDGTLAYVPGGIASREQRELIWMGRDGTVEPIRAAPLRSYLYPRISPDGARMLLDVRDQENDIWLWDLRRETLTNVTRNPALDRFPLWTADGRSFIFVSDREGGRSALYRQAADGTGEAERLTDATTEQQTPNAISRDGTQLLFDVEKDGNIDLMSLALDGSRRITPLIRTMSVESRSALSPDGRWLAYHSDESGQSEIYVRPFPMVNAGKELISTGGAVQPWWSRTGEELFYKDLTGMLMAVRVTRGATWSASTPTVIRSERTYNANPAAAPTFDVSPDGRRFLMIRSRADAADNPSPSIIVVVQNWFEELKRLVPQ